MKQQLKEKRFLQNNVNPTYSNEKEKEDESDEDDFYYYEKINDNIDNINFNNAKIVKKKSNPLISI